MLFPILTMRNRSISFLASSSLFTFFFPLLAPAVVLAFGVQVTIDGETVIFGDVPQSAWFATYVRSAAEAGIVNGYRDDRGHLTGEFGPGNNITVAEALKIAVEGAGYTTDKYAFKIQSGVNHWSSAYVSVARAEDFPVILSSLRRLDRAATRSEVAAIFTAAFQQQTEDVMMGTQFTDVDNKMEFAASIEVLSRDGVVSGDTDIQGQATGTFRPNQPINRAEVVKMIMRARAAYGTPGTDHAPEEASSETGVLEILYNAEGFSPQVLRIKKGETVTFRNESTAEMWVASDPHPSHTNLPSFEASQGFGQGEAFTFRFAQIGTWGFHNHIHASHVGSIIVEQ